MCLEVRVSTNALLTTLVLPPSLFSDSLHELAKSSSNNIASITTWDSNTKEEGGDCVAIKVSPPKEAARLIWLKTNFQEMADKANAKNPDANATWEKKASACFARAISQYEWKRVGGVQGVCGIYVHPKYNGTAASAKSISRKAS